MAYFINKIDKNIHNHYKYHYLDHISSIIDLRESYWAFDIDLFSINDFSLPINSLAADLQLPYQEVKDISFNLASDQSHAAESVEYNKQYCRIYNANFNVDISQNEYLKQDLQNIKFNLELSLFIDPEAAKGAGEDIKQEDLDPLMVETMEQRWNFYLYYTNTHIIQQNAIVDNTTGYTLINGTECMPTSRAIQVNCGNLVNLTNPLNDLAIISSTTVFQILSAKIKFEYWLEDSLESQTLESVIDLDHSPKNKIAIHFDKNTAFDYLNNKVIIDPNGIKGFYIPKYSHGKYELELMICQGNTTNKFIISNNFSFANNVIKAFMSIYSTTLKDKEGQWGEVKTYD